MAATSEYDGICLLTGDESAALSSVPEETDRVLLYYLSGKCHITEGQYRHTQLSGKAVSFEVQRSRKGSRKGSIPKGSLAADAKPTVALSGAPDCLCVHRLATKKSITLIKSARRAGLYPYNLPDVGKVADTPRTVRSPEALDVVDVEHWRLRTAQEEDEEMNPFIGKRRANPAPLLRSEHR